MKKVIALLIVAAFVAGLVSMASAASPAKIRAYIGLLNKKLANAKANRNWARVNKLNKMIAKQKARLAEVTGSVAPPPPPVAVPPPPPPMKKIAKADTDALFGWGVPTAGSIGYVANKSVITLRADAMLPDPLGLGPVVGLPAEAVMYRVGLGGFTGNDNNDTSYRGILINLDGVIMIPAEVLGGIESYLGGGINYQVYRSGSLGGQIYYGIAGDVGLGGKSFAQLGYTIIRTGALDSSTRTDCSSKGITLEIGHMLVL
ncbi:hypothetical protein ACFL52_02875 [Candidatus Margulisiibacteriota bacterium]